MRDEMLSEANQRKMAEEKANWLREQERSKRLEAELKAEKEILKQKREQEKIAARKVIVENEEEKKRRLEKQQKFPFKDLGVSMLKSKTDQESAIEAIQNKFSGLEQPKGQKTQKSPTLACRTFQFVIRIGFEPMTLSLEG